MYFHQISKPNPPFFTFFFSHFCACHPSHHTPLFLCLSISYILSFYQIFGYVCVQSIQSTSRLYVTESLRTSSSLWRGNLNCSVERACCFAPGTWGLLSVTSSSLNLPTWMRSGQTTWAGHCWRRWKGFSSRTLWRGQRDRRGSGCLSAWIKMIMKRAGNCCLATKHTMKQTGGYEGKRSFVSFGNGYILWID